MNVEQFCSDYGATVELLPGVLGNVSPEVREQFGYSLEEKLLWRRQALAQADHRGRLQIEAIDGKLVELAALISEHLGLNVREFLAAPETSRHAVAR